MATPLGLVVIGAFFHFEGFMETLKLTAIATSIKLVVIPFMIAAAAYAIGIDTKSIILVTVALGGPAAVSSFAMCNEMGGDSRVAGNIIILTSALCVFSFIAMITILLSL